MIKYDKDLWRHILTSGMDGPHRECWPHFATPRRHGRRCDLCPTADKVRKLPGNKLTPANLHVIQTLTLLYNGVKPPAGHRWYSRGSEVMSRDLQFGCSSLFFHYVLCIQVTSKVSQTLHTHWYSFVTPTGSSAYVVSPFTVLTTRNTDFKAFRDSSFCPHGVFKRFEELSQQTGIAFLNIAEWLEFVMQQDEYKRTRSTAFIDKTNHNLTTTSATS